MKQHCGHCQKPLGVAAGRPEGALAFCGDDCVWHYALTIPPDRPGAAPLQTWAPDRTGLLSLDELAARLEEIREREQAAAMAKPFVVEYPPGDDAAKQAAIRECARKIGTGTLIYHGYEVNVTGVTATPDEIITSENP